jgi:hypothetical protein
VVPWGGSSTHGVPDTLRMPKCVRFGPTSTLAQPVSFTESTGPASHRTPPHPLLPQSRPDQRMNLS